MKNDFFGRCKLNIGGIPYVRPVEVAELLSEGAVIVDLRDEFETEIRALGVENVIYLPYHEFEEKWNTLPLDKPVILADSVGLWSKKYALFLTEKGYKNIASLAGGINEWEKDGMPMKTCRYEPLNGVCLCMIKPIERK